MSVGTYGYGRGVDEASRQGSARRDDGVLSAVLDSVQTAVIARPVSDSAVIVGGPGSGKTTALVRRAVHLTRGAEALPPDAILAVTPSRQSATMLRDELAVAVGRATSGPLARSLTSFAFQIVRAAAVMAGEPSPQLLTGADEDQIIGDLLAGDAEDERAGESRWPEWLSPEIRATAGFRAEVRTFFAECTTVGVGPDRLRALGARDGHDIWQSLSSFLAEYRQVRAVMRGAHRDAAGLVREAVEIVRREAPGIETLDRLRVLLVDDAQELTYGGVALVDALRSRGIAVMAFGDPDVGSGAFRGATPANFASLVARIGTPMVLDGVHRGTPAQHDVIRRVTQSIGAVGVVHHRTPPAAHDAAERHAAERDAAGTEPSLRALTARSSAEEFDLIARLLRERHVHDGVEWSQCAVIAHDTRQVAALHTELAAREVPTRTAGAGNALGALAPVRDLMHLLELASATDWTADEITAALSGTFGRLDAVDVRRLRSALRHRELAEGGQRSGRELLLSAMRTPLELDLVDMREARRAAVLARTLEELRTGLRQGATAHELLWTAWSRSGLERAWSDAARGRGPVAERAHRDLDAVVAVFQSAKRFVERSLDADPMVFVRSVIDSAVADDRLDAPQSGDFVRVMTPAGSLGLEFDTVVVAGVQDGVWPNTRLRGSLLETWRLAGAAVRGDEEPDVTDTLDRRREAMSDELRLLVRALSRATEHLIVTAVDDDDTGPSVFFEFFPDSQRAVIDHPLSLRGLVARHRRLAGESASPARRDHSAGQLALLARAGVPGASPQDWYGVKGPTSNGPVRDVAREAIRVSPSRLHTLEECELNWVIGDLGGDAGSATAGLGTIIHAALENSVGSTEAQLWEQVESRWGELDFEAEWRDRAERARARDMIGRLHRYLSRFEQSGGALLDAEPHFEVAIPMDTNVFPHGAILSGYIDRVELTAEGTVVIVDLKTGKREPQTDAKVLENPQLAAYQLAFDFGAIPAATGHPSGGAKLLVLTPSSTRLDYAEPRQAPFDDERRDAFLTRVREAVSVMGGTVFRAPYEEHCRDEHSYGLCRIHTIGSVSAS
ncbi:ATP-dependent helicase [Microbacterium sp. C7(2022)]|nr:ATP-dependent helicase [Microbacterium sp. C7(2022)]